MVIGVQNEILIGIKKLPFQVSPVSGHFSNFQIKRDLKQYFHDLDLDFVLHSDNHFESHLPGNGLYGSPETSGTNRTAPPRI